MTFYWTEGYKQEVEEASSLLLHTVQFKDAIFGLPVLSVDVVFSGR